MRRPFLAIACLALLSLHCASVAKVTTLSDPGCRQTFTAALAKIMENEGETTQVAGRLAESTAMTMERS